MKRMSFLFILILFAGIVAVYGQDKMKLDSLQLQLASTTEDTLKFATLLQISDLYSTDNYSKAVEFAKQAKELAEKSGLKKLNAKADNYIGNLYIAIGDYKSASLHYFNAIRFYEEAKDTLRILAIQNNLGVVYDRLEEFDKALSHYFKAQDLYNHLNPEQQEGFQLPSLYNNIANIYQTKHDTLAALQYYEKALLLARENNNKKVQGIALNNLGKLYMLELQQPVQALDYLLEGLKVREEYGDKAEIAKSLVIISQYYFKQKKFEDGKAYAERAIALSKEIGSLETQLDSYESISKLEFALGRPKESLIAYKFFKKLSDSIRSREASSEITRLQLQYDFEKAEKIREAENKQSRIRYISTIIVLSLGLLIATLLTILVRTRARQSELKRKNLLQDVEIKNKELTTNVMYLIRKNELINDVAERLLKLQHTALPENQKKFHDIIIDLQKEADNDSWKEFELRFNQVHSEFYNNLRKLYPGLSPADEKLCAFLRLNMSSKEIAAITQQSIKSVEVARARLRKKLNLTNTTSNLVTHLVNL